MLFVTGRALISEYTRRQIIIIGLQSLVCQNSIKLRLSSFSQQFIFSYLLFNKDIYDVISLKWENKFQGTHSEKIRSQKYEIMSAKSKALSDFQKRTFLKAICTQKRRAALFTQQRTFLLQQIPTQQLNEFSYSLPSLLLTFIVKFSSLFLQCNKQTIFLRLR